MRIIIEVVNNGYVAEVWQEDFTEFKEVFTDRDDLYHFIDWRLARPRRAMSRRNGTINERIRS